MNHFLFFLKLCHIIFRIPLGRPERHNISLSLSLVVISITLSMILFPEPSFKAAERGLTVWWDIVLPALLPFFVAAELLMGIGIVHFIGVLMEPLMRPIFNVPVPGLSQWQWE